jgi:hypothetical protein
LRECKDGLVENLVVGCVGGDRVERGDGTRRVRLAEPLNRFSAYLAARIGARDLEQQIGGFVAALLRGDKHRVLAETLRARAALAEHLTQDRQCRFGVHLHQTLEGRDAHVVIVARTAALVAKRFGLFGNFLRGLGIAAARLSALDARAERLRFLACRCVRIIARLLVDRVDGITHIALAA